MEWLIWSGSALTMFGLAALVWCIAAVSRVRKAGLDDTEVRVRLRKVVAVNMAALGLSGLGLMTVILGIVLS
jgi:hypothetical protein